jgi:hypothetical protein
MRVYYSPVQCDCRLPSRRSGGNDNTNVPRNTRLTICDYSHYSVTIVDVCAMNCLLPLLPKPGSSLNCSRCEKRALPLITADSDGDTKLIDFFDIFMIQNVVYVCTRKITLICLVYLKCTNHHAMSVVCCCLSNGPSLIVFFPHGDTADVGGLYARARRAAAVKRPARKGQATNP